MLRNYLLIAFRNLWHNKVYALINILGLAIGLTAALFIFQYVQFERSYDSFHKNGDNIYRIIRYITRNGGESLPRHRSVYRLAIAAEEECPEVMAASRVGTLQGTNFALVYDPLDGSDTRAFFEEKVYFVGAEFMEMFSFPLLIGDSQSLDEANTLLLSETMAQKFFGPDWQEQNPIGKILTMKGGDVYEEFMVQGIFKDIPENSHIKFEVLGSYQHLINLNDIHDIGWRGESPAYLQVDPNADIKVLEQKIQSIFYREAAEVVKNLSVDTAVFTLQPLKAAHLYSQGFTRESEIRGNHTNVRFLQIAAYFILLLAWVNYVNLSTAQSVKRAKEVGIRKVIGAQRRQLITQFLLEAFLINLFSIVVALTLYQLFFPQFISLVQKDIPANILVQDPKYTTVIALILIFGTLLSGGYSAFVLSNFKAVHIMKGFATSARGATLRKGLIVLQFVVSVGLVAATFGVFQQLAYMKNADLGLDISQKIIVRAPTIVDEQYEEHYESFTTRVKELADVDKVTGSFVVPGDAAEKGHGFLIKENEPETLYNFDLNAVDKYFLDTYELEVIHGRGFSEEFPTDKHAVVISEDGAVELGYVPVESALQQKLEIFTLSEKVNIIGIAKDANILPLNLEKQIPQIFFLRRDSQEEGVALSHQIFTYFTIKLGNVSHLPENLTQIEELYKSYFPGNPFEYFFLDSYFNGQYQAEEQFGKVFTAASGLAIFIACLGLFGLSAFMIKQRTKEIGIRKVMGAPVQTILLLLSRDYFKLILLAGVIALPIAYFSLHRWLESYTVRIPLSWWLFLTPLAIVVLIALVTVSVQTIKAALANPAKSLRYE